MLGFVNTIGSAEELALAAGFPDAVGAGGAIARRILERREALGGKFSEITQLSDIPLLGPERFSGLVAVATGQPLPGEVSVEALWAEVRALRRMLAAVTATPPVRITLQAMETAGYVGQPVDLRLRVTEGGRALAGARLIVTTTWGYLQTFVGLAVEAGPAISVGTDVQGEASLQLLPALAPRLTDAQQHALSSALGRLDRESVTPTQSLTGLQGLADQYRRERSTDLRAAIDVYFQEQRRQLIEPINPRAQLAAWDHQEALILAYLQDQDGDRRATSPASLVVRMKDWLGPWFQAYQDQQRRGGGLREDLDRGIKGLRDNSLLLERALTSVHSYVAKQRGQAGEAVAQRVADHTLRGFMATGLEALPATTRLSLFPALDIAAKTIRGSGIGALASVTQARIDLRNEVNTKADSTRAEVGGRIAAVESELVDTRGNLDQFRTDFGNFTNDYGKFKQDRLQFGRDYTKFKEERTQFGRDYAKFNKDQMKFDRDYTKFKTSNAKFNSDRMKFDRDYTKFKTSNAKFGRDVKQFNAKFKKLKPILIPGGINSPIIRP